MRVFLRAFILAFSLSHFFFPSPAALKSFTKLSALTDKKSEIVGL